MTNNYWMHRITCGENASPYAQHLFFGNGNDSGDHYLSIGWCDFSYEKFVEAVLAEGASALDSLMQEASYGLGRSRFSLYRFIVQMKRGDVVVVPIWDTFSVCRISDDRVLTNETIDMDLMTDGHGNRLTCNPSGDRYLYASDGKIVDMGFYRKVELLATGIPRSEYAPQLLYSAMKNRSTNAALSAEVADEVDIAISDWHRRKPVNLKAEIENAVAGPVLDLVRNLLQDMKFESLVEWYLTTIGADVEKPAKNSCPTEDGDADLIAHFDSLETTVMVQVKKHDGYTGDWAVRQITSYSEKYHVKDFMNQMWVISSCDDYSDDAKQFADEKGVRLITGLEFAKMILGVGIKSLTI